jgi:neutral trehalase
MKKTMFGLALGLMTLTSFVTPKAIAGELPAQLPAEWKEPFKAVYVELQSNLQKPNSKDPYYHAWPAKKYQGVYLWDSSFISLIWNKTNPKIAEDVVKAVLNGQQPDGRVPHVITMFGISEWTQPPVLAWATSRIAADTKDTAFIREVYPKLRSYHSWLMKSRRLSSGLFFWQHPYESGLDNSPRFGARDESSFVDTRVIDAIDLSSYVVLDAKALIAMAREQIALGATPEETVALEADIAGLSSEAEEISQLIRTKLWDESTGYFYDFNEKTGERVMIPTLASFFPLVAGVATPAQAARMMEHLRNPEEFNTTIPFPTVARNSKWFDKDCWRGPVWVNTAYLTMEGMKAYGYNAEAKDMAYRLVDGVYKTWNNTKKFVEYYDPDRFDFEKLTRKRGVGWFQFFSGSKDFFKFMEHLIAKQLFLGTKPVDHFIGWTGLVNTIVLDDLAPEKMEIQALPVEEPVQ